MENWSRLAVSNVISIEPVLPFPLVFNSHQKMLWIIGQFCVWQVLFIFLVGLVLPLVEKKSRNVFSAVILMIADRLCSAYRVSWQFVYELSKLLLQRIHNNTLSFLTGYTIPALHFQNCCINSQSEWGQVNGKLQ